MTEEEILADAQIALMTEDDILADAQAAQVPAVDPKAEAARKYAEQAGTGRALGAGLAEGATFGFSDEIQAALDQLLGTTKEPGYLTPEERTKILQEQQGAAYMGGDILASLATGLIPIPGLQGAGPARMAARLGVEAGKGAIEGAGRAEPGERLEGALGGAAFGAAGGAVGEGLSALAKGRQAGRVAKATEKAMKNPQYVSAVDKASKIEKMLLTEQNKLETIMGKLESEKIGVREQAEKGLRQLLDESRRAAKDVDGIRVKLDQSKPASRTSPEFVEYQQAKAEVDRLQKMVDANTRKLQEVEATAPTKLGAERERAIVTAERGVQKAEQRVLSAQEEQEVNDILKKVFEGEKAAKKAARKAAKQAPAQVPAQAAAPEAPAISTIQDLTRVERELIEDFFANSPESSKLAAATALGMDKSTFNRRMTKFGLTPESAAEASKARAAQKADIARAAEELVPSPTPPAPPRQEPMPRGSMFSRADVRKMRQQGETLPTRTVYAEEGASRAREAVKAAEAPIVPTFQSRFAPEIDIRQEQVSQLSNQLDEAMAVRDEALRALQQAQSPQARAAIQQNLARAEQVTTETAQAYDDALKAFESQSFTKNLVLEPQVTAQQRNVQRVQQEVQKANEIAQQLFNKDVKQLTAQETSTVARLLESLTPLMAPTAIRTTGARQQ